jgi:hypothetical protein
VHSGGAAGRIAFFIFSAGTGTDLKIVYRNQRLYRVTTRLRDPAQVVYERPRYAAGDDLCCPSKVVATSLGWNAQRKRFVVTDRQTLDR